VGRPPTIQFLGAIFHVLARRVDRWPLFVDEADYRRYVRLLEQTVARSGWVLLSFCLMPNHIHLMVELREPTLAEGMHWLHMNYVRWFNDRHGRNGKLFEHRYKRRAVDDELYFITLASYIEQNPVRAGLSASPEEWPWSSRGIVAAGGCPLWLADDQLCERRRAISGT
jgi:REP-associated tyrosine transposase